MVDITVFFNWFLAEMVKLFTFCLNLLDSISIGGVSVLALLICIFILGLAFTLIFTNIRSAAGREVRKTIDRN